MSDDDRVPEWYVWRVEGDTMHLYGPAKPRSGVRLADGPHGPYTQEQASEFCDKVNNRSVTKCN